MLARLILGCFIVVFSTPLQAQERPPVRNGPRQLRPISFTDFSTLVFNGEPITGRIIPPNYILRVLAKAPLWAKNPKNKAWIRLRSCRVTGQPTMKMAAPSQAIGQFRKETRDRLQDRYPEKERAIYLSLPVDFTDVEVGSDLNFADIVIRAPMSFDNVDFNRAVSFQGAVFERAASFHNVHFKSRSDFSGALIQENLNFEECQFARQAAFSRSVIGDGATVYFSGYRMDAPLDFSESTILGKLTFEGVTQTFQLAGKVYLNGINFGLIAPRGELRIKNAELRDETYLDRDRLFHLNFAESEAGFHRPIRFMGSFDFRQSTFKIADLGGVEFEGFGDFTGAIFTDFVNVERTKFRKPVQLKWKQLDRKLGRPDRGLIRRNNFSEIDKQSYEELERNFNAIGDIESSNECRYQRRLFSDGRGVEWAVFGYEVHPLNPSVTGCLSFVLFCLINAALFAASTFSWSRTLRFTSYAAIPWKASFPPHYRPTHSAHAVFWVEWTIMKVLWFAFTVAWMNKSPLLKELIPYLWPK